MKECNPRRPTRENAKELLDEISPFLHIKGCIRKQLAIRLARHFVKFPKTTHQRTLAILICRNADEVKIFLDLLPALAAARLIRFKNGWAKPHISLRKLAVENNGVDQPRATEVNDDSILARYEFLATPKQYLRRAQERKIPNVLPSDTSDIIRGQDKIKVLREMRGR